ALRHVARRARAWRLGNAWRLSFARAPREIGPGPVILSNGKEVTLEHSGFPIGVAEKAEYEDAEVTLQAGDRFWLYSDGLVEAMNIRILRTFPQMVGVAVVRTLDFFEA
ncbi:MAG: SpoIIE family protein phosphatase, partial [Bryobacteraceae bacterium]